MELVELIRQKEIEETSAETGYLTGKQHLVRVKIPELINGGCAWQQGL